MFIHANHGHVALQSFAGAVPLWALQTKKWLWKEDTLQGQIQICAVHKKFELLHHDTFGWSHENGGDLAALTVIFPVISMWMFDDSARNFQRFSASIWSVSDSIMLMAGHFLKCLTIWMPPETKKRNRFLFWYNHRQMSQGLLVQRIQGLWYFQWRQAELRRLKQCDFCDNSQLQKEEILYVLVLSKGLVFPGRLIWEKTGSNLCWSSSCSQHVKFVYAKTTHLDMSQFMEDPPNQPHPKKKWATDNDFSVSFYAFWHTGGWSVAAHPRRKQKMHRRCPEDRWSETNDADEVIISNFNAFYCHFITFSTILPFQFSAQASWIQVRNGGGRSVFFRFLPPLGSMSIGAWMGFCQANRPHSAYWLHGRWSLHRLLPTQTKSSGVFAEKKSDDVRKDSRLNHWMS